MVTDPYSVLEISRDASKEEIKRAYRKKAKEYHPDLHPNDSKAAEKMNEINEAYDMLSNPEKYQKREQSEAGYGNQNHSYGDYQQRNTYGGRTTQGYGSQGNFWDFNFDDVFGFGERTQSLQKPSRHPNDSEDIKCVVDFISMDRYDHASRILNQIISSQRNARWHYLNALTNHGLGNQIRALEEIQKAVQMEPNNQIYKQAYNSLRQSGNNYQATSEDFRKAAEGMNRYCMSLCAMQFFCMFCRCC